MSCVSVMCAILLRKIHLTNKTDYDTMVYDERQCFISSHLQHHIVEYAC
jgi:hypothetical protein